MASIQPGPNLRKATSYEGENCGGLHRLFSEISKNWAAEPLDSYEKMLKFIRPTSTKTGLIVTAYLDPKEYPTGLKPDPSPISSLRLKHSDTLPKWNYTIAPNL